MLLFPTRNFTKALSHCGFVSFSPSRAHRIRFPDPDLPAKALRHTFFCLFLPAAPSCQYISTDRVSFGAWSSWLLVRLSLLLVHLAYKREPHDTSPATAMPRLRHITSRSDMIFVRLSTRQSSWCLRSLYFKCSVHQTLLSLIHTRSAVQNNAALKILAV